ncbi:MAG: PSD1 and planctomycete cytochrome C domain-containing protein [Lentisphaerales bacterium]|nr:PSD1 and planctomycete cytochrome C domain-containing protein [Lentisphaerales bacterium]
MNLFSKLISLLLLSASTSSASNIPADQLEFFENKIRPVLAESCYECHNSVDKKKGKLALDWKDPLLAGGAEGLAVIPGNPKDSLLIKSIKHLDDLEMPSKAPKLSDAVIADFEKWIMMGAPDPRTKKPTKEDLENSVDWDSVRNKRSEWWSFQPLKTTSPEKPAHNDWQANKIDHYIFKDLKTKKLQPSEKADKYTLLRRVYLTLTGLPPTPEQIELFISSNDPQAYEKVVDSLLDSKEYGERWARYWMDWYRFSQSHGSEGDPAIPPSEQYRDYLIRALNSDIPYDQLLKEHIAGDLLAKPRINKELGINESAIGPAHFRFTPIGFGVTDAYDEQVNVIDNQVDVLSKAMLGLTVSCARCHNHKFDPISQKDFFRLYGVMLSTKQSTVVIDTKEKQGINQKEITTLKVALRKDLAHFWYSQLKYLPKNMAESDVFKPLLPKLKRLPKGKKLSKKERNTRQAQENKIKQANDAKHLAKQAHHPFALYLAAKNKKLSLVLQNQTKLLKQNSEANQQTIAEASHYIDFTDSKNSDKYYLSGNGAKGVSPAGVYALKATGNKVVSGVYPAGIYSHLISSKHASVLTTTDFEVKDKNFTLNYAGKDAQSRVPIRNYPLAHGGLHPPRTLNNSNLSWQQGPGRWQYWQGDTAHFELRTASDVIPRGAKNMRSWFGISELYIGDKKLNPESSSLLEFVEDVKTLKDHKSILKAYQTTLAKILKNWATGKLTNKEALFLQPFIEHGILSNELVDMPQHIQAKVNKYRSLEKEIPFPTRAPGLTEAQVVDQKLMVRGDYKKQTEVVHRQFLEVFKNEQYTSKNSGRLDLAEDMISQENTLKSRVLVNRLWAYIFGKGLVKSTDNFGRLGSKPTHPELLDYLALNFENNGWSIKSAIRHMVTSRTFKSASQSSAKANEIDPENDYLSFYLPRRLDAEAIYDTLNFVSGKRTPRAVYDKVIRNRLNPFLTAFNRPTPVTTVSTRLRTNVPAQALTMMNSFTTGLSGHAANKVLKSKSFKTDNENINALFMTCFSRPASKVETQQCQNFLNENNQDWNRLTEVILNSKEIIYVY